MHTYIRMYARIHAYTLGSSKTDGTIKKTFSYGDIPAGNDKNSKQYEKVFQRLHFVVSKFMSTDRGMHTISIL